MNIHKHGHCCLVIETNGKRIMTDPGNYTVSQNEEKNIDIILITHEHADHFHIESVKAVLANNPNAKIITNHAVGKLLDAEHIAYEIVAHGGVTTEHGVLIEGFGEKHAEIYKEFGQVENTGYFIDNKLFYPGDAYTNPGKPVDVLALPTAGPWMKMKEAVEYVLEVKPRAAFPVHDAMMKTPGMFSRFFGMILPAGTTELVPLNEGESHEF